MRYLIGNLERNQFIALAHVNPKCFDEVNVEAAKKLQPVKVATAGGDSSDNGEDSKNGKDGSESSDGEKPPAVVTPLCSMWFIGLEFQQTENLNVDLTESIQNFTDSVHKHAVSQMILKMS